MGLMTFKYAPDGKVLKTDVAVAKNYLPEQHIRELERIVSSYLDLAENRAERQILMKRANREQQITCLSILFIMLLNTRLTALQQHP